MPTTLPSPTPGAQPSGPGMRRRLVRLMDTLSRGASPPGMIDMAHTRQSRQQSHLRRRFTMIARFDGNAGRWSATGLAVSSLVGGIAFTGAVNGQEAAPAPTPAADPAAARQVGATAKLPPPPASDPVDAEAARKLWDEKYAARIIQVDGREVNRDQVDREYLAELAKLRQPKPKGPAARTPPVIHDEDVDEALLAQLDRKIPELNFDGAALADVVDFLRDVSNTNMVVEWRALENAGVDRNAPVSVRVRDVKFSRALDMVLRDVSGGTVSLGYTIDGNVIRVSTGEHLDSITDVRAYDVRDITASEAKIEDLTRLITETVSPDSWRSAGGTVGVILPTRNKLVVTQTPMNHRQIRSVLQMLREDPRQPATADAASAAHAEPAAQPTRR